METTVTYGAGVWETAEHMKKRQTTNDRNGILENVLKVYIAK